MNDHDKTALLLIDIQNDYFPDGRMELAKVEAAACQAAKLLQCWRDRRLPVIHVAHESVRPGAGFFLPGTAGQKIHQLVTPRPEEPVIIKNFPNSFLKTTLLEWLRAREVHRLVIAGMMTHMCVDATVRAAKDLGFHCTLVHDATATRDLAFAGNVAPAAQVQTAFIAALSSVCDGVSTAEEIAGKITAPPCRASSGGDGASAG